MCNEHYLRRRREEEESREIWREFGRTRAVDDREPPADVTEPETTEAREAVAQPEQ